jgi:hypothetical protein
MSNLKFGTYNPSTGETMDGYIDKNGNMAYKPTPWYKKLFYKLFPVKPYRSAGKYTCDNIPSNVTTSDYVKKEYIGVTELYSQWIWSNKKKYFSVAVYRDYYKSTGETISLYSDTTRGRVYYNVKAFDVDKFLIMENDI